MNDNHKKLSVQIESLLFALGKPLSRTELSKILDASTEDIDTAIAGIVERGKTEDRGVAVVDDLRYVELRVVPEAASLVEKIRKEEFSREIGRAGAEVLAVLLYTGPSTRTAIDFIRGVNSTQAIRTLMMRGLIRRASGGGESTSRSITYELTTDALASLGLRELREAPDYEHVQEKLSSLQNGAREN